MPSQTPSYQLLIDQLSGSAGIGTYPTSAAPANGIAVARVPHGPFGVDTPEDLARARDILKD